MDIVANDSILAVLARRVAATPDQVSTVFDDCEGGLRTFTYSELDAAGDAVAGGLWAAGVRPGTPIVLYLANAPEFLLAWLGANKIGASIVPCNTNFTADEATYVVGRVRAPVLITDIAGWEVVGDLASRLEVTPIVIGAAPNARSATSWDELVDAGRRTPAPPVDVDASTITEIIFTSGTSADPKGVLLSHGAFLRGAHQAAATLGMRSDDRLLTAFPLFHINAQLAQWVAGLVVGATSIFQARFSASTWAEQAKAHDATVAQLVGTMVRMMMAQPPRTNDADHRVRVALFGLAVELDLWHEFERRFGFPLVQGYGLTEAALIASAMPLYGDRRIPSVGRPTLGRNIRVALEDGSEAAAGEVGELTIAGELGVDMMSGYFDDPAATAAAYRDGWLHTGDLGYADEDGYLYFVDREKDIIKRSGENVSALEVELALAEHPAIGDVAVIAAPDPIRDEAIVACLTVAADAVDGPVLDDLVAHATGRLARFKRPSVYVVCPVLPRNAVGKVDKKVLRREFHGELITGHDDVVLVAAGDAFVAGGWTSGS